ncbi:hypothetical protein [Nocardioides sp.]|uniref:hypothetical protein n=1 Tax=Nocardioides sp. TaxID=35761 RepID=UPI0035B3B804
MQSLKSLGKIVDEVRRNGFATTDGGIDRLAYWVRKEGWSTALSRPGQRPIEVLKPTKEEDSHQRSISARYGTGRQPFHSDCAHHRMPPDVLLLSVDAPSAVPTLLWGMQLAQFSWPQLCDMREGLFTVRSGSTAFLAPALDGKRLRFDPVCMTPADPRAARASLVLTQAAQEQATPFEWATAGQVLAIDNHQFLHARDDASSEPDRLMKRLAIRYANEPT